MGEILLKSKLLNKLVFSVMLIKTDKKKSLTLTSFQKQPLCVVKKKGK